MLVLYLDCYSKGLVSRNNIIMYFSRIAGLASAALLLWSSGVVADACDDVENLTAVDVSRPLTLSYISEQNEYWSEACSMLKPVCIVFPTTADEVAAVVKILGSYDQDFAVKSGGHSPNKYFASVEEGLLISMSKMDHVILDQQTGILKAGPGNRLDGIAKELDGTGWTFVGGRIGNTGIGECHCSPCPVVIAANISHRRTHPRRWLELHVYTIRMVGKLCL